MNILNYNTLRIIQTARPSPSAVCSRHTSTITHEDGGIELVQIMQWVRKRAQKNPEISCISKDSKNFVKGNL